jgi:hypothetical protein
MKVDLEEEQEQTALTCCALIFGPHGGLLYWAMSHECSDEVRQESRWMKAFPPSKAQGIITKKRDLLAAHIDWGGMFASMRGLCI